ncbi:MAG: hypothetical protein AB8G05_03145 [Oligoflexales bacterium]
MRIINYSEILDSLNQEDAYRLQKDGFIAFAGGRLIQPPVAHLELANGSLHIKYGMLKGDSDFVVKHATGFGNNSIKGIPTGDGFLATFCANTGILNTIVLDRGFLTNLRTAFAVRLCAEHFAPKSTQSVGIVGMGNQARLSIEQQAIATGCRNIYVWGRNRSRLEEYRKDMENSGFTVSIAESPEVLLKKTDLIITSTSSKRPLLHYTAGMKTKLIIAVGADENGKQELDSKLIDYSDRVIGDDPAQCLRIGELQHSNFNENQIFSLGRLLREASPTEAGLTIVDLTGLAIQDIQMVKSLRASEAIY